MATNNRDKNRFSFGQMGDQMVSLIDEETAPAVIRIEYNNVICEMAKVTSGGRTYYTGVPKTKDGHKCKFGFTLDCSGYFEGSAAMNYIAMGGWRRGTKKPTHAEKAKRRTEFVMQFLSNCIHHRSPDVSSEHGLEGLKKLVSSRTGMEVVTGEMTPEDLRGLALMAVPFYLVEICKGRGLKMVLDIPKYVSRLVQPQYAKCELGEWDHESGQVAITSALSAAQAQLMQEAGYRFRKVQYSVKAAAEPKKQEE